MPTIYDILPTLEKQLRPLLKTFMEADDGEFHLWEIAIFLPATNASFHYLDGVNISLKNGNYISAMANLRGLLESIGAIAYDSTAKLPKEAYDAFMKTGRLPKWDEKKKKWTEIPTGELVKYTQKVVNPKININSIYKHCCEMLHFSGTHMSFMGGFSPKVDEGNRIIEFKIGAKDNIPVEKQKEIISLCVELVTVLGRYINGGIQEKNRRKLGKNNTKT